MGAIEPRLHLIVELLIEGSPGVGLLAQGRTAEGGTHQGRMNAGFDKVFAEDVVLDRIEGERLAHHGVLSKIPDANDVANAALERVLVDDRLEG